ncbi:MAG: hypothetical protein IJU44_03655 [Kiritimatiellae bacterium]|nr:hypothetical protein [Kiritimatiellia bacterium]
MRPIAADTNDFPKLRERGCNDVDKTDWKWEKSPIIHFEFVVAELRHLKLVAIPFQSGYLAGGCPIWLIWLSFDSKPRHLVDLAAVRYGDVETASTRTKRRRCINSQK